MQQVCKCVGFLKSKQLRGIGDTVARAFDANKVENVEPLSLKDQAEEAQIAEPFSKANQRL